MLINMVKAVTTRSGTRNTTLVKGTKEQPPLRTDMNTDNTPRAEVSKETMTNNSEDNPRDTSEFGRASKFINHPNNLPDFTPDTP